MGSRGRGGQHGSEGTREGAGDGTRWLAVPGNPAEAALREALDQAASREADEVALRRVWAQVADLPAQNPLAMAADAVREAAGGPGAMQPEPGRRSRGPWIVAASLAGATAALAFMLVQTRLQGPRAPQLSSNVPSTQRAVTAQPVPAAPSASNVGSSVVAPATVRTAAGETLHLTLRGGTDVTVMSESALVLDDKDRPSVSVGEVVFQVPKQAPGHTFEVSARHYRVVVIGTRFSVRVDRERTAVGVSEGVVEVWTDHRIARVAAGESWSAAVEPRPSDPAAAVPAAAAPRPQTGRTTRPSRVLAVSSAPSNRVAPARTTLAMAAPALPGGSSAPAAPPSSMGVAVASRAAAPAVASAPAAVSAASAAAATSANDDAPAPAPGFAPAAAAEVPLTAQARAARAAGDSRRALGLYRTLAQRGGAAGENAEYEIGRILRDNLHQPREALAAWQAYRSAHPRGLLRIETDLSVIETLIALDDNAEALAEATEFMRRYPESERRSEVARLAGDLLREGGDCAGAIAAYDTALSGRVRRGMTDGVTFHRAACVQRRDRKAGTAALKTYLQSFPSGRFRADAQKLLSSTP
jgi:hypothetical protein